MVVRGKSVMLLISVFFLASWTPLAPVALDAGAAVPHPVNTGTAGASGPGGGAPQILSRAASARGGLR